MATSSAGAGASGSVTPQEVYQQVLSMGGSEAQAQVAAALVDGIESNGELNDQNPTSTASGLFQFLTTTWDSNGGSAYAPTAGAANLEQQVQVYLNASKGNNFYPWAPDLGGSYNGQAITTPAAGSPVADKIAANAASIGYTPIAAGSASATSSNNPNSTPAPAAAPAPAQSVTVDGQTFQTKPGDNNASSETSAIAQMASTLEGYGFSGPDLQTLTQWAWTEITNNVDPSQVAIDIQTPGSTVYNIFDKQFPGFTAANEQLTGQGLQAVSVQQYQQYQTQATAAANAAGLPPGFLNKENIGILIGNNVSSAELTSRLNDAVTLAYQSTPEQQVMFNQYFGTGYNQSILSSDPMAFGQGANFAPTGHGPLTPGQIAALALDPNAAEPLIHQQIAAAQLGGAGVSQGSGAISAAEATKLAEAGVSPTSNAFIGMGQYAPLETALPGANGTNGSINPDQLAESQLLGTAGAVRQQQLVQETREAPFKGGGGFVSNSKGTVGAGSASSSGAGQT